LTRSAAAKVAAPNGRITMPDGVEMVSINLGTSRTFASACVDEWARQAPGEPSRHHLLRNSKAIWVPASVLDGARRSLQQRGVVSDE
jgi:hypothetical protein